MDIDSTALVTPVWRHLTVYLLGKDERLALHDRISDCTVKNVGIFPTRKVTV